MSVQQRMFSHAVQNSLQSFVQPLSLPIMSGRPATRANPGGSVEQHGTSGDQDDQPLAPTDPAAVPASAATTATPPPAPPAQPDATANAAAQDPSRAPTPTGEPVAPAPAPTAPAPAPTVAPTDPPLPPTPLPTADDLVATVLARLTQRPSYIRRPARPTADPTTTSIPRSAITTAIEDLVTAYPHGDLPPPFAVHGRDLDALYNLGSLFRVDDGTLPIQLPADAGACPRRSCIDDPILASIRAKAETQSSASGAWQRDLRSYEFLLALAARQAAATALALWSAYDSTLTFNANADIPDTFLENAITLAWFQAALYTDTAAELDLLKLKVTHSVKEANNLAALYHEQAHARGFHGPLGDLLADSHRARREARLRATAKADASRGAGRAPATNDNGDGGQRGTGRGGNRRGGGGRRGTGAGSAGGNGSGGGGSTDASGGSAGGGGGRH
eukprot:m.103098 g.103098  ORF g.103098 m.103098 type:complete len:447 (+) comp10466_c0_seq1:30-1370(+)